MIKAYSVILKDVQFVLTPIFYCATSLVVNNSVHYSVQQRTGGKTLRILVILKIHGVGTLRIFYFIILQKKKKCLRRMTFAILS